MKNLIFLSLSLLMLFSSCGDNSPLAKEETYYIVEDHLKWVFPDVLNESFFMRDSNGITYSYTKVIHNHDFTDSWSSFFGFTTSITHTESYSLEYRNNALYDLNLTLLLTAGFPPFGDYYSVNIGSFNLMYDFKYNQVFNLYCDWGDKSYNLTDDGFEYQQTILSNVTFIDELQVYHTLYSDIMHVEFLDFKESYDNNTVTDLYFAADIGLLKIVFKNGVYLERIYDPSE